MHSKPRRKGRVTYVFQELNPEDDPQKKGVDGGENQKEQDESIRNILQQKERIRSIITPGNDEQKAEN